MLLSEKPKKFFEIYIAFLESIKIFAHFEENDQLDSVNIS